MRVSDVVSSSYSTNLECYSPKYCTSELHDPLSIQIQCIKMRMVLVVVRSLPGVMADEQTPHAATYRDG